MLACNVHYLPGSGDAVNLEVKRAAEIILTGYDIAPKIAHALNNSLIMKYFRKRFNVQDIENAIENAIMKAG